jgi:hypothetical protein
VNKPESGNESENALARLGAAGDNTIISLNDLAQIFHRHPESIKRAIERGELPPPVKFLGVRAWTVKVIVQHIEARLAEAEQEREKPQA